MIEAIAVLLGLATGWALGIALVAALYRLAPAEAPPPAGWVIGCGWFVGVLGTTMTMRALSWSGVPFSVPAVGIPVIIAGIAAAWYALAGQPRRLAAAARAAVRALAGGELAGWQRAVWLTIVAWLALRFALLLAEIWWRPLYPWDAWTQWGTKARVWFEMRGIVPFVGPAEWFAATPDARIWYDAAPHYPGTMPLMQTLAALLLGRWDDTLVNLPWWCTGIALGAGLHGGLRLLGLRALPALAGAALVLTLPIVNVHVALAGYADLPLAAYLTLGAIAAFVAIRTRNAAHAALAVLLFVAMVLVKNPGKAWVFVLLPAFIVAAFPRHGLRIAAAMFAVAAFTLLVAARSGITLLGYRLTMQYAMPWGALFDAYFSFANWHLLWYAAVATAVLGWRQLLAPAVAPFTVAVAGGLLFLLFGFAFTNAGAWVEDQSTVNRATLHLAPLVVVWMLVCLRARWQAAAVPVRQPAPA